MVRDRANIPIGYYKAIPNRSNWLAYILMRAIVALESNGQKDIADALHQADADWIKFHVKHKQS